MKYVKNVMRKTINAIYRFRILCVIDALYVEKLRVHFLYEVAFWVKSKGIFFVDAISVLLVPSTTCDHGTRRTSVVRGAIETLCRVYSYEIFPANARKISVLSQLRDNHQILACFEEKNQSGWNCLRCLRLRNSQNSFAWR